MPSIRATEMDSIPRFSRETSSRSCLRYQEVEIVRAAHSRYRNPERPLCREIVEKPAQVSAPRTILPRSRCLLGPDRYARQAAALRIELQPLLRDEGSCLDGSRKDFQRDQIGARVPEGRRPRDGEQRVARPR